MNALVSVLAICILGQASLAAVSCRITTGMGTRLRFATLITVRQTLDAFKTRAQRTCLQSKLDTLLRKLLPSLILPCSPWTSDGPSVLRVASVTDTRALQALSRASSAGVDTSRGLLGQQLLHVRRGLNDPSHVYLILQPTAT